MGGGFTTADIGSLSAQANFGGTTVAITRVADKTGRHGPLALGTPNESGSLETWTGPQPADHRAATLGTRRRRREVAVLGRRQFKHLVGRHVKLRCGLAGDLEHS